METQKSSLSLWLRKAIPDIALQVEGGDTAKWNGYCKAGKTGCSCTESTTVSGSQSALLLTCIFICVYSKLIFMSSQHNVKNRTVFASDMKGITFHMRVGRVTIKIKFLNII